MRAASDNDDAVLVLGAIDRSPQDSTVAPRYSTQFGSGAPVKAGAHGPRVRAFPAEDQKPNRRTEDDRQPSRLRAIG